MIREIRVRKISLLSYALASCGFDLRTRITRIEIYMNNYMDNYMGITC